MIIGLTCALTSIAAQPAGESGPSSNIAYVGVNSTSGTAQNIPAATSGDMAFIFAGRISDGTVPTLADIDPDWLTPGTTGAIDATHSDTGAGRFAYSVRPTESGVSSGTFTNAQRLVIPLYSGVHATTPILALKWASGTGTTATYPALTYTSSTAWVGLACGFGNTTISAPAAGTWAARSENVNRAYYDSGAPLSAFGGATSALLASVTWVTCAFAFESA